MALILWHDLFFSVCRDVTECKQAENEVQRQLEELQRRHNATLEREGRVFELNREVNELLSKTDRPLHCPDVAMEMHVEWA